MSLYLELLLAVYARTVVEVTTRQQRSTASKVNFDEASAVHCGAALSIQARGIWTTVSHVCDAVRWVEKKFVAVEHSISFPTCFGSVITLEVSQQINRFFLLEHLIIHEYADAVAIVHEVAAFRATISGSIED